MSVYPPSPAMIYNGTPDKRKTKRPPNVGSRELSNQENEMFFQLIGPDAVSLTAAIVQLLKSDRGSWQIELPHGVISLVKDYAHRAYFIRIFDILEEQMVYEFKLYKGFQAKSFPSCSKLLAYQPDQYGDGPIVGLNFYSAAEAAEFKEHLDRRHAQEKKSSSDRNHPQIPLALPAALQQN
ncbi:unnamed protein product [Caenorhabditis bovis]|uniref:WH1 domain-containing protein n=1 Tax=Caenorhabditis bovis TaxID=2654633 RepID=A0A8S1F5W2_9PELO|nr:unnamed protein product [Caenorhabditis bovis]